MSNTYYAILNSWEIIFWSKCIQFGTITERNISQTYSIDQVRNGSKNIWITNIINEWWKKIDIQNVNTLWPFKDYISLIIKSLNWNNFSKADANLKSNIYLIEKNKYLVNQIKSILENFDIKEADKLYQNHGLKCIDEAEYIDIKKEYINSKLIKLLKIFNFQKADKLYQNHGIQCIDKSDYDKIKNEYVLQQDQKIKNDIITTIIWKLQLWSYTDSDFLYEQNNQYITKSEYIEIKKTHFIDNLKSLLEKFDFQWADTLSLNHWITCFEINEYNSIKKEYIKRYFNDTECQKMNDEKYSILADMSQYTLVKARAGTGKTTLLKYKIKLLTEKYWVKSDEILAFAFNKKAAQELMQRTQDVGVRDFCSSMTFHSFAWRILSRTTNEPYELLFDDNTTTHHQDKTLSQFTQQIIKEYIEDKRDAHKEKLYKFFRKEADQLWEIIHLDNNEDIYNYYRSNEYSQVCLNGVRVKSIAEKRISDFLFEYDIKFRYENPVTNRLLVDWNWIRRQLRPDFTLIELHQDWIQNNQEVQNQRNRENPDPFWNIQAPRFQNRKVLIEFRWRPGEQTYQNNMNWKRNYYNQNRLYLIDFCINEINYRAPNRRELFEDIMKQKLESHGINCKKLLPDVLFARCRIKFIKDFTKKIISFIQKAKQNKLYPESMKAEFEKNKSSFNEKQIIFYEYAIEIYSRYQKKLKSTDPISKDFNDLLFESWEILVNLWKSDQDMSLKIWKHPIQNQDVFQNIKNLKYILVDEYQDFSLLFYSLLEWIRYINPHVKLINVWDDWQLINTFAWSKITYISEYKKYFDWWKLCTLLETNRCPKKIINISNNFMQWYGDWAKSKSWNIDWMIVWKTLNEINFTERWVQNEQWGQEHVLYTIDTAEAKFFWKQYKDFPKREIEVDDGTRKEIIIVPKKNSEYAQLIKTLYNLCILEKIYSNSFDMANNHIKKDTKYDIMILHRSNTIFNGVDHWQVWEDNFSINDVADHLVYLLYETIISHWNIQDVNIQWAIKKNLNSIISSKSIHQSKWWEAEIVVILWIWEDWLYPMVHPDNELNEIFWETIQDVLAEERRLFYVALTRTKNKLYYLSEKEIPNGTDHGNFLIESRW